MTMPTTAAPSHLRRDTMLVDDLHPSPNFTVRRNGLTASLLVLHYTGLATVERSIEVLADPKGGVSCHYVIGDDGRITQMVAENMRAWQAGVASWCGVTDVNSASIGIEIQNPGHGGGYPDFPAAQMRAVHDLSLDIVARHGMRPAGVVAHSDIAPARKSDPGEKFDWPWLARAGIGHWVAPEPITSEPADADDALALGVESAGVWRMQMQLARYGYGIEATGVFDTSSEFVVRAFQRHFRPALVDGRFDRSTSVTLDRLIAALPADASA